MNWQNRISKLLILINLYLILLTLNSQNATLTNAVSSNNECEEEIRLICRNIASLQILFRFTNVIRLPINTSIFADDPSFISISVRGNSPYAYGWWKNYSYVNSFIKLSTEDSGVSQGKSKADILIEEFTKSLNTTLLYDANTTYRYKAENPSHAIQKLREAFLEHKPSQGFSDIVTPTLLDDRWHISIGLEREAGDLKWKTEVHAYIPDYIPERWFGWLSKEYTISLKELADYSGNIISSPNSTKSTLSIRFSIPGAFLQILPKEEVRCLETVPSQMNVTRGGEVFEMDIIGGSVEDLYIRFKWVMPWWSLIGVTVFILGAIAIIVGVQISPTLKKCCDKIPGNVLGFLLILGIIVGLMSILLIILNILFLFNPFLAFNQYGWIGFGVWLGIWIAIVVEVVFPLARRLKKRKEPKAWELEDQLKELKEQLGRGVITQEEYEQKKKKLLED